MSWQFEAKLEAKCVDAANTVIKLGACHVATELEESNVFRTFVEIVHVDQANRVPFGIEATCWVEEGDVVNTSKNVACYASRLLVSGASVDGQFVR